MFDQHVVLAGEAGLSREEIERTREPVADWSGDDRVLLRFVEEMIASDGAEVTTWGALAERFSPEQLLELPLLVGFYRMLAGFLVAVGVEVEDELRDAAD